MLYMAVSLSVAGGLLLYYLLSDVHRLEGQTLNAVLANKLGREALGPGARPRFALITLISEAPPLRRRADGLPRRAPAFSRTWRSTRGCPHRFSLSERLVTQNGVLVMGLSAIGMLLFARGSMDVLVLMYSINVFLTFTLSQLGMCVHWWQERKEEPSWGRRFAINGFGLLLTTSILLVTVTLKFGEGGWVTVVITGSFVALCLAVRSTMGR